MSKDTAKAVAQSMYLGLLMAPNEAHIGDTGYTLRQILSCPVCSSALRMDRSQQGISLVNAEAQ